MRKYEIIIYWSDDDQALVAEVPELPGCTAHGDTQASVLRSANEAIKLWIATAQEFGGSSARAQGKAFDVGMNVETSFW